MSKARGHIFEIHFLRAFACLCVLLVHVSASYFHQNGQQFTEVTYFINQISRFGTSLFAVISGFLLVYQSRFRDFNLTRFITSRFTKIGLPFLFWSIFYLAFNYVLLGTNPFESGYKMFLVNFAYGGSHYHLYFMSVVFQFYLIYPLLQKFKSKKSWSVLLVLSALNMYYLFNIFDFGALSGVWEVLIRPGVILPYWIYFFVLGGFMAHFWEPILHFSKQFKGLLGIAFAIVVLLAVYEYKTVGSIGASRLSNVINIPIIILFVMGMTENIKKWSIPNRFLTQIGTLSMAIYLVHPFVLTGLERLIPDVLWNHTMFFPIVYLALLGGSVLLIKLFQLLPYNQYILTVPRIKKDRVQKEDDKYRSNHRKVGFSN
ncbi:acyltransferase [Rossellomorea sp. KS-H15a]|uniref:acyltransferase n=1 Tax=Rossellomorea sp. KS-H15a TaxID=2963940 RepID=UPI0020C7046E|nr:acyltransferase [Rossellomorea sp. KS-H15a]UTE77422.1 acyltransferase [Rossellomorea sp. KS-H15a]